MANVIIEGLSKAYQRGVPVLRPLDLTVEDGELFFLLGPSGCGKSTLLRILAGLVEPDSGSIRLGGCDVTRLPPEKRGAAMVFQNYALWPHLSVFENVAFGLRARKVTRSLIRAKVEEALALVRLEGFAERRIPSLSGGQQQRVALARALAVDPAVLLLDEPLSNLDARLRDTMRREISRITRERRLTAIYVTHDRQEALSMGDRLAVMHEGVIRQTGTPAEVYRSPRSRFVASFLGDANFLEGEAAAGVLKTSLGDFPIAGSARSGRVVAAIRPEHIRVSAEPLPGSFPARLTASTYLGEKEERRFTALNGTELLVSETDAPLRAEGSSWNLSFAPERLIVLEEE